ncbi:ral GTPase-activating protein subunit alpha-2-like [Scleropages formosus]|uniref:Ral GTPase-activating protein subunit alpha-2-like n=1 Tax=Scleropages formosus TaxID=113540 RepID=A0A0P7UIH6_SCLFO|nr:ral GTPase-activating protein subunit alpha-2-like [Scleropages formosus]
MDGCLGQPCPAEALLGLIPSRLARDDRASVKMSPEATLDVPLSAGGLGGAPQSLFNQRRHSRGQELSLSDVEAMLTSFAFLQSASLQLRSVLVEHPSKGTEPNITAEHIWAENILLQAKILRAPNDACVRLVHSRLHPQATDILEKSELKPFFEAHYSQIYFIFYENFMTLESNLKQKGSNLKKLLHTGNSFKVRSEGIRLFLLWLQALQNHCSEEQYLIFACLVPGFPAVPSSHGPCTLDTIIYNPHCNPPDARVVPEEITPLVPAVTGEKVADDPTCYILQTLLKFMVLQASSLEWRNKENQDTGFRFLFTLFRKYYLPHLFPSFTKLTDLYKPLLDLPHLRPKPLYVPVSRNNESTFCTRDQYLAPRVAFITWLVTFFLEKKYISSAAPAAKNGVEVLPKIIQTVTAGSTSQEKEKGAEPEQNGPMEQEKNHSNSSTLSDRRPSNSSLCSIEEEHRSVYDMVHCILLSTRDNVNFVNEVFHQAFLLPSCEASTIRKVIKVYRKWILQEKPIFMVEPEKSSQEEEADDESEQLSTETDSRHVQVFLTNSANVFLLEPCYDVPKLLENQVEVCKSVLNIYRRMIMEHAMNRRTWEQMLQVLLRVTEAIMKRAVEGHRKDTFAESLASLLFRTIIVAWVRANLSVFISRELWDDLLAVLSSLTDREELVSEWASIMDSLTAVLARSVYGLDLGNLPLDKLSEQKEKRQRGRGVMQDHQKSTAVGRSFSLSWRNQEEQGVQEPMRFRSATTSGAPGVEKARNSVRQKATGQPQGISPKRGPLRSQSISNCVHLCEALPATKSVPVLLHTVTSFLPDVEEGQLSEGGGDGGDGDSPLPRSSSVSDITQQTPDGFHGPPCLTEECSSTANDLDSRTSLSEGCSGVRKEGEPPVILVRRSSSPPELEYGAGDRHMGGRTKIREKSESISSETSNGYLNDADVSLLSWQTFEGEQDSQSAQHGIVDPDSQRSLTLSHTEALAVCTPVPPPPCVTYSSCVGTALGVDVAELCHPTDSSEYLADDISIIAGGSLTGWHPDSAAVLWRRILGILGDVNSIRNPKIHARVFMYLHELWHKLAKIRDNLGISMDNQSSPPRPVLIPPLRMLASWLFKATMLPAEFKAGKLQAYRLICEMMTKHQDVLPNSDFLVHFYHVIHQGLNSEEQDVLNTVIRHCSPRFFSLGLPGFTMLVGDFITAAARVLGSDISEAPRIEAQTVLGSLVCFPNLYMQMPLLQTVPGTADIIVSNEDIKDYLVNILLQTTRTETCEEARCIAICSLGIWICEELVQQTNHPHVKDAINVLGVTLKFGNKVVSHVACDLFQLLVYHWQHLEKYERSLPKKITEIFVATIAFLLPSAEHSTVEADKKLMVSLLLCLLDWCMALPLSTLLEPISIPLLDDPSSHNTPLLDYIYRVLHCCVSGSNLHTQQSHYLLSLADLSSSDYDPFLNLGSVRSSEPPPAQTATDFSNLLTVAEGRPQKRRNMELIPLTARMVMTHLVNHLGHHPLSGGPALLHSLVSENHDNPYVESSELSSEVFKSPNLQLFVFNDSTLVSYLQVPPEPTAVGQSSPVPSQVRVIVRDISGKYSWDGGVLHRVLDGLSPDQPQGYQVADILRTAPVSLHQTHGEEAEDGEDVLDELLESLGQSSPECLQQPQPTLNQPAPSPCGMTLEQENAIVEAILRQTALEEEHVCKWSSSPSVRAACQREPSPQEPGAPFYFCRLLLNDLGMNSWERRKSFHLLKKNSKLLRELKNLDSRQCRETHKIAVFYIADGQEDKCSILSNTEGSQAYEDFVSGLGWEVDLATHCGFMGGLQRNGSTGLTAPYYATSTVEVIFHVSTRMPSDSGDSLTKKLRHLGNDEVHIVWSEHTRDYRRGIIPTDFGDVLIIIYPMKNHMFYVQIMKKPQVPFFGPLFNGAIVTGTLLPSLVRATCVNASRAVKSRLTLYQSLYPFTFRSSLLQQSPVMQAQAFRWHYGKWWTVASTPAHLLAALQFGGEKREIEKEVLQGFFLNTNEKNTEDDACLLGYAELSFLNAAVEPEKMLATQAIPVVLSDLFTFSDTKHQVRRCLAELLQLYFKGDLLFWNSTQSKPEVLKETPRFSSSSSNRGPQVPRWIPGPPVQRHPTHTGTKDVEDFKAKAICSVMQ